MALSGGWGRGKLAEAKAARKAARKARVASAETPVKREKFLPLTRFALMDRLARPGLWPDGQVADVRRFFQRLDYMRQQTYVARKLAMFQTYEPFSPDSDLLVTRVFSPEERATMQTRLVADVRALLEQANYERIDHSDKAAIMTKGSHYGLDLSVELDEFEELLIYYRGSKSRVQMRRNKKRLYLFKEEFEVPIFQRLCILFKLKPLETRVKDVMRDQRCDRAQAEKLVKRARSTLPEQVNADNIYLKLFKNIPRTDIEMVFPNTQIKFRMFDKLKLGASAGGGLGAGAFGAASKLAVATNPFAMAGAVAALGGVAVRQGMNFVNQKNKYMVTMAQNLYFHAMADNRGAMTLIADDAAEQDIKEEMLLYAVLAKTEANISDLDQVDEAIEQYMHNTYGFAADFEIDDALSRLVETGIVTQRADGTLDTLAPAAASDHVDKLWDRYLDDLPEPFVGEGTEFDAQASVAAIAPISAPEPVT
jgi:Protein of unknown function (DUF3754)